MADHPYCAAWLEAGRQAGHPANPDFNGALDEGLGAYQLTLKGHWRSSAATAFLAPVRARPNLKVLTGVQVTKVLLDHARAIGVEWQGPSGRQRCYAEAEVILAGGALQSPHLLQLSGIGAAGLLGQHGIEVIRDAPEVGANLQDHYQARVIFRLREKKSLNNQIRSPIDLAKMGAQWLFQQRGPLTVGAGQVGGMVRSAVAKDARADVLFNVMPLSVDKPGDPLHKFSGFSASAAQCRPESRGSVALQTPDPLQAPKIISNYLTEPHDIKVLVEGLKLLRDIYQQPAFRDLITDQENMPGNRVNNETMLADFARQKGGTIFHPVGTCRMGSDEQAVVDARLRVQGIENLRVADASVMPTLVSANTNAAAILIGEKGADLILRG